MAILLNISPRKSQVSTILEALEQKVYIPQTKSRYQIDWETEPIKSRHLNPQQITYKQSKIAFKKARAILAGSLGVKGTGRGHNDPQEISYGLGCLVDIYL